MKTLISITAAALAIAAAGAVQAQDSEVAVAGTAEASCTLPDSWSFVSQNGGASGANFSGTTWTIPEAALAGPGAIPTAGAEYAIRVRGTGFCNASHTIRLQSTRGGLVTGDPSEPAPAGFVKRRAMNYAAHWAGNGGTDNRNPFGPQASFTPSTPGQQSGVANYVVSGALAPPGNRIFDVRMGFNRGPLTTPLVAGAYSDSVTVTIALAP